MSTPILTVRGFKREVQQNLETLGVRVSAKTRNRLSLADLIEIEAIVRKKIETHTETETT